MKKFTLSLAALALSAMSFAALNPFAYGLKSEVSADNSEVTISYSLNAEATSVKVVILNGETVVKTLDCADKGLVKGDYTVTVPAAELPANVDLTWKVEVTGAEVLAPTQHDVLYSLYHPSAVDIDNNPENATFGLILTNEGMHKVKGVDGYISTGYGAGIYAFTPAFEPISNGENPGFNGGIEFTNGRADNSEATAYSPRRVRISDDGRIFVTSLNTDGNYLWEVNPENLDEWNPVFKGVNVNEYAEIVDADGNFIVGPNCGFDVKGVGEDLKLMMYSVNTRGITAAAMGGFKCAEYNLGVATEWTAVPSKVWIDGLYAINYSGTQVTYDNEGGVWVSSYREKTNDSNPGLVHINANGEVDYVALLNYVRQAGLRFNNDFTKMIVAGVKEGTANPKKATIYTVSKDEAGKPVLTEDMVIDMATLGNNLNDFAFDYAGNLYGVSNSGEKIVAWAMPHATDAVVATPAAKAYVLNLSPTTLVENLELAPEVQKVVRNGQVLIVRDGKTFNMMGQEIR